MGSTKLSEQELAERIELGRYDLAAKCEVKAFVDRRLRAVTKAIGEQIDEDVAKEAAARKHEIDITGDELNKLHLRIKELELTSWQRFKRWAADFVEDVLYAIYSDPSDYALDDTRVVAESPYTDAINAAAEGYLAENGVTVGDAMRTEQMEDLPENLIDEAIAHIKAFEGEAFDPNRYLLPAAARVPITDFAQMTSAQKDELLPQHDLDGPSHKLHASYDGELTRYTKPDSFRVGDPLIIPPEELFPSLRPQDSLGDPEE